MSTTENQGSQQIPLIAPTADKQFNNASQFEFDQPLKVVNGELNLETRFIKVSHINRSGVRTDITDGTQTLFVRQEWRLIWKSMCTEKDQLNLHNNLIICGPPGTGKSSLVWAWCCWYAKQGHRIRWIRPDNMLSSEVVEAILDKDSFVSQKYMTLSDVPKRHETFDVLVVDGFRNGVQLPFNLTKQRFILVSSLQVITNGRTQAALHPHFLQSVSWSFAEYKLACLSDDLWKSLETFKSMDSIPVKPVHLIQTFFGGVSDDQTMLDDFEKQFKQLDADNQKKIQSRIDRIWHKFYWAGRDARYMFHFTYNTLLQHLLRSFEGCNSIELIITGMYGHSSDNSVNSLFTKFLDPETANSNLKKYFSLPVSEYVLREFLAKFKKRFIVAATEVAQICGITSLDSWVLQLDVLYHLEEAFTENIKTISFFDKENRGEVWKIALVENIVDASDLKSNFSSSPPTALATKLINQTFNNCWLIPTRENQPCFDALQLLIETTTDNQGTNHTKNILRVIQITSAMTHSLKIGYVAPFYQKLKEIGFKINFIDIVAIIPFTDKRQSLTFKFASMDFDTKFDDLDYEFCQLFGYNPEEIKQRNTKKRKSESDDAPKINNDNINININNDNNNKTYSLRAVEFKCSFHN